MLRRAAATVVAAGLAAAPALAQPENCTPVRFEPGRASVTLRGIAPAEGQVCYRFDARAGQTADLRVTGRNTIVTVLDVGDAREHFHFRTNGQTYRFIVAQLMRAASPEAFSVTLSIR